MYFIMRMPKSSSGLYRTHNLGVSILEILIEKVTFYVKRVVAEWDTSFADPSISIAFITVLQSACGIQDMVQQEVSIIRPRLERL